MRDTERGRERGIVESEATGSTVLLCPIFSLLIFLSLSAMLIFYSSLSLARLRVARRYRHLAAEVAKLTVAVEANGMEVVHGENRRLVYRRKALRVSLAARPRVHSLAPPDIALTTFFTNQHSPARKQHDAKARVERAVGARSLGRAAEGPQEEEPRRRGAVQPAPKSAAQVPDGVHALGHPQRPAPGQGRPGNGPAHERPRRVHERPHRGECVRRWRGGGLLACLWACGCFRPAVACAWGGALWVGAGPCLPRLLNALSLSLKGPR